MPATLPAAKIRVRFPPKLAVCRVRQEDLMVIVAGFVTVEPTAREAYLAGCKPIVAAARAAAGCLDFAISADLVDSGRINIFEHWASQEAVQTFRGNGPSDEQGAAMLAAEVAEYDVAAQRWLTGDPDT